MSYLGNSPLNRLFSDVTRIATQGQTAFQFSYTPGVAIVSRNGVILDADEFTATDGSLITLATPANAGDSIRCIALNQFNVADALPLSGGSMGGPLTLAGNSVDPLHPTARQEFGASLAASGYQKLPSGLILQWGVVSIAAGATATVTLPIAVAGIFSTSVVANTAGAAYGTVLNYTTTSFNIKNQGATTVNFFWIAVCNG
mgnify:CR=1 FL=1